MKKSFCIVLGVLCAAPLLAGTPAIDGTLDAAAGYAALGTVHAPGDDTSFGGAIDCSAIYFTEDATNLYFFIQGKQDTSGNGIAFFMGTSAETGIASGVTGVGAATGGHIFDGNGGANISYALDFEVDHAWVGNSGGGGPNFYIDAANLVGARTTGYSGNPGNTGGTLADGFATGVTHAFDNAGTATGLGSSTGWEISIPRTSLGNVGIGATVNAWAIVVSDSAFFSTDAAPGIPQSVGTGFDRTYNTDTGSPLNASTTTALPVTLDSFGVE